MSSLEMNRFVVVTPEGVTLEKEVSFLRFHTPSGELGILPGHTPTVSQVSPGALVLRDQEGNDTPYFISSGMIHVELDRVVLTTDYIESQDHIDEGRARDSEKRAKDRLKSGDRLMDHIRAHRSLVRAQSRLFVKSF